MSRLTLLLDAEKVGARLLKIRSAEVFSGHHFNSKAAFDTHGLHCFVLFF